MDSEIRTDAGSPSEREGASEEIASSVGGEASEFAKERLAPGSAVGIPDAGARVSSLSPRQREVFGWICEGKKDREIAEILGISYRTVTEHVRAVLAKLQVPNRTSAAMLAVRSDTVEAGPDREGLRFAPPVRR